MPCVRPAPGTPAPDASGTPFYATHLQQRLQYIGDLEIAPGCTSLQARLGVLAHRADASTTYAGLQAAHDTEVSAADAIVCLAQLAQAISYELDGLDRDETANFWLRRLNIDLTTPRLRLGDVVTTTVQVDRSGTVRLAGETWRTLRLGARGPGLRAVADVAHVLPAAAR